MNHTPERHNFRLLGAVYVLHFIRHGMVFPLIPLFAQELGGGPTEIGLVASSFNLLAMFLATPIGGITEKAGIRAVLLSGAACNVAYSILLAISSSLGVLILAQIFGGLGFLFLIVSSQTYVSHLSEAHLRERGFGFLALMASLGFMLGPPLGGALSVGFGYRRVFALSGLLAATGIMVFFLKKESGSAGPSGEHETGMGSQLKGLFANSRLVGALVVSFMVVFVVNLRSSFLPVLLKEKALDETTIGVLYGVSAVAMAAVRLTIGRVMGRVSREGLLAVTLILLAAGYGLLPLFSAPGWLGAVLLLAGFGFGISQPLTMVMVSDFSRSGLAMGVRFTMITSATVLSPLLMGWIVHVKGLHMPFYAGAIMILGLGLLWVKRPFQTRI